MTNANAIDVLMGLLNQDTNNPNLRRALDLGICALKGLDVMKNVHSTIDSQSEAEIKLEKISEIAFSVSQRKMSQYLSVADLAQANHAAIYKIVEILKGEPTI